MERTVLGRSGLYVSRVGMGGCPIGGHGWGKVRDDDSIRAARRALDLGVNFFDTADVYGFGHSEEILARAFGKKCKDVVIATKFGTRWYADGRITHDVSPGYLRDALDASLRRLKLDCVQLYYIHWPDGTTPIADTMEELVRCREAGKIRWIGLSNFTADQVREALEVSDVQAVQVQLSLVDRAKALDLLPLCREKRIPLVTWGSLAQGLLTGKYDASSRFGPDDRRSRYDNFKGQKFERNLDALSVLTRVAARNEVSPAQAAMRWLLDTPGVGCVLFGAKTPEQVEENAGALDWRLDRADYEELDGLDAWRT